VAQLEACKASIIDFVRGLRDFETSVWGEKILQCFSYNFQEMCATF